MQAAAAAASLALDNERLKADLRARVEELRASRVRIVEASNAARQKVERDLHDGAQQQLVALALELQLLRNRVGENTEALASAWWPRHTPSVGTDAIGKRRTASSEIPASSGVHGPGDTITRS